MPRRELLVPNVEVEWDPRQVWDFCGELKIERPVRVREGREIARRRWTPIPGKRAERVPVPQRKKRGARRLEPAEVRGRVPEMVLEQRQERGWVRSRVVEQEQLLVPVERPELERARAREVEPEAALVPGLVPERAPAVDLAPVWREAEERLLEPWEERQAGCQRG